MVRHDDAVSHAILAEFVLELLDVRLSERPQPLERAMPIAVDCRKFTMRAEGEQQKLFGVPELRFAPDRRRGAAPGTLVPSEAVG